MSEMLREHLIALHGDSKSTPSVGQLEKNCSSVSEKQIGHVGEHSAQAGRGSMLSAGG